MRTIRQIASKPTININSHIFAPSNSALIGTLFEGPRTASGTYKKRKHSVLFYDMKGELFACLVAKPGQSKFFVSASRQADGRNWFQYGLSNADEQKLGLHGVRFMDQNEIARNAWEGLAE